ncbi:MAG: hypothetical protein ACON5I_02230 [Verrucomicrobiales bacterium]
MKRIRLLLVLSVLFSTPLSLYANPEKKLSLETRKKTLLEIANDLKRFGDDVKSRIAIKQIKEAKNQSELNTAIDPMTLIDVSINPESRVKISSTNSKITLAQNESRFFVIRIDNTAGITATLNLSPIDLATDPPTLAKWCTIEVVNDLIFSNHFSGKKQEYKLMKITPKFAGLKEIRISGDAGQGTQDLGFRATADLLLEVNSKEN